MAEQQLDIPRLLDPEDVTNPDPQCRPDEQCFMTYLSEFPIAWLQKKQEIDVQIKEKEANVTKLLEEAKRAEEEAKRREEETKIMAEEVHNGS